jgi:isoleucyl-tRNA synthetase
MNLKDTLNLPQTDFPMRGNMVEREPERLAEWEQADLYQLVQQKNAGRDSFILHDGPPFTNGDVHIGTALNKTLKDIIVRYKSQMGYRAPYHPGWDCHGLPIEDKVARQLKAEKLSLSPLEIRQRCAAFSERFMEIQRNQFKRLGLLADWKREYRTMNPAYEAEILRCLAGFVEQGLVYRGKKPVYWSIPYQTALAEAEIEYRDHTSIAVYVAFSIVESKAAGLPENSSVVIWTTTPWTLPANLAVAVHPRFTYVVLAHGGQHYIVAEALAESFVTQCKLEGAVEVMRLTGADLAGSLLQHPFIDRRGPILTAEFVTAESGTGCVHIAPGHGMDDYHLGLENGLEVYCPVQEDGTYADDGQIPARLVGKSVLDGEKPSEANLEVLRILKENGKLLHSYRYGHSYPHCWRSKTPVIFRAADQWFVSMETESFRARALEAIGKVEWIPAWGESRIRGAVEARPDWCISRQRSWGVPIPAVVKADGTCVLDPVVIRAVADRVETEGTDVWFREDVSSLLAGVDLPESLRGETLTKGGDTLDVWLDSGCSHLAVLARDEELSWPADLYLEGSDQHRGWFQSSLWTAVSSRGEAPYRKVLTHSFIINTDGSKVSKSEGKPQTADAYVGKYGADILRLWIASEDFRSDIPISEEILVHVSGAYRSIRNTLRFLLGNVSDFNPATDTVEDAALDPLDQWALAKLADFIREVSQGYETYAFHKVYQALNRFCSVTLSATYHDILKDRLYTLAPTDSLRRSSQTVLYRILEAMLEVINPILPFTSEEAWVFLKHKPAAAPRFVALLGWPVVEVSEQVRRNQASVDALLRFKSESVNDKLEALRTAKAIGQSLDAQVVITGSPDDETFALVKTWQDHLAEFFVVSSVVVEEKADASLRIEATKAPGVRCPRTWRWVPELVETLHWGPVSPRCQKAHDLIFGINTPTN